MRTLLIGIVLAGNLVGCGGNPLQPSSVVSGPAATVGASGGSPEVVVGTSRVLVWPPDVWLEHDPSRADVQVCATLPRAYSVNGLVRLETDFYTVVLPEVCPVEPIE